MTNITDDVLLLLQCPITRQPLVKAKSELLDRANGMIHRNQLTNRLGEIVDRLLDEGLVDEAGEWLYPVRDGIVCLSADEAILQDRFDIEEDEAKV